MTVYRPPLNVVQGAPDLLDPGYLGAFPQTGDAWYVDPTNGSDGNSGRNYDDAFATLPTAYAAATANQHDVVYYIAGTSSISLSAQLTWAKSYTHLIGIAAPTRIAQRARIFQTSTATGLSPLINITASGCIFANFYVFQGVDDATSLINVQVTGGRNYFYNVHFAGGGHATQAINGGMSLKLNGCEENTFVNCTVGVDTVDAATGLVALGFDGEAHRNIFDHCTFRLRAGNAGAAWVEVLDGTGIDRDNLFDNCFFINNHTSNAMDTGFIIPAISGPRKLILKDCIGYGASAWDSSDTDAVIGNMGAVTGADLSGVAVGLYT